MCTTKLDINFNLNKESPTHLLPPFGDNGDNCITYNDNGSYLQGL